MRLVADGGCEPGQRYVPINVNLLFGEPTVALRGPWGNDLVGIAPKAEELGRGLVCCLSCSNSSSPMAPLMRRSWSRPISADVEDRPSRVPYTDPP